MSESPRRGLRRLRYSPRRTGGPQPAPVAGQATPDPSAASVLRRVAALLRGGVPSSRVWGVLGQEGVSPPAAGCPEWRVAAAAWRLARTSGVPLSPALERLAAALGALEQVAERREVLLAGRARIDFGQGVIRHRVALGHGERALEKSDGVAPEALIVKRRSRQSHQQQRRQPVGGARTRGWERGQFEVHFPKRFTGVLKLMRCLPYRWYFPLVHRFTGL